MNWHGRADDRAALGGDEPFDFTESTLRWIGKNTPVDRFVQGVEIISNQAGGARMGYTIFGINGAAPTLTSTASRHYERYRVGDRYRRLTNVEYARIQGFPDSHCSKVSVYDQYALIGNAVPPPMAGWIMDRLNLPIERKSLPRSRRQKVLFEHANEACKETARAPSDAEWKAILASPLEGAIGVSLALQWRYNFGRLFDMEAAVECPEE